MNEPTKWSWIFIALLIVLGYALWQVTLFQLRKRKFASKLRLLYQAFDPSEVTTDTHGHLNGLLHGSIKIEGDKEVGFIWLVLPLQQPLPFSLVILSTSMPGRDLESAHFHDGIWIVAHKERLEVVWMGEKLDTNMELTAISIFPPDTPQRLHSYGSMDRLRITTEYVEAQVAWLPENENQARELKPQLLNCAYLMKEIAERIKSLSFIRE